MEPTPHVPEPEDPRVEEEIAADLASITDELDRDNEVETDTAEVATPSPMRTEANDAADLDNYADGSDPAIDDLDPDAPKDLIDLIADGTSASAAADASSATAAAAGDVVEDEEKRR